MNVYDIHQGTTQAAAFELHWKPGILRWHLKVGMLGVLQLQTNRESLEPIAFTKDFL